MNEVTQTKKRTGSRNEPYSTTLEAAIADAASEVEALYSEMEEWASNMESNSMESLPKYDEVEECRSALENPKDVLEGIELPEGIGEIIVSFTQDTRKSASSRSARLGNALIALRDAESRLDDLIGALTERRDELTEACDELENIDFPGMF